MDYDNNKKRKEQDEDAGMLKLAAFYLFMSALCAMMAFRLHQNGGVSLDIGSGLGEGEAVYRFVEEDQIVTQELIGKEIEFEDVDGGHFKAKFKGVTAYDNIYSLCGEELKENLDHPRAYHLYDEGLILQFSDDGTIPYEGYSRQKVDQLSGETITTYQYPNNFDEETGQLKFDTHIFVFEVDITNIDAVADITELGVENVNQFNFASSFYFYNRSDHNDLGDTRPISASVCYMEEGLDAEDKLFYAEIPQGETKTLHLGYFMWPDNSEHPYTCIGLDCLGNMLGDYDESKMLLWFDLSKAVAEIQNQSPNREEF